MHNYLYIYIIAVNIIGFLAFGIDKRRARRHAWRISEATLLSIAALGGSIGAWCGMRVFHHKSRKKKFTIGIPLLLLLQSLLVFYLHR